MLLLTRTKGQSIKIYPKDIPEGMTVKELFAGGPIEITVTETYRNQCKIGIDAPRELTIVRDEIYEENSVRAYEP